MMAGATPPHQQHLPTYFQQVPQISPFMRNQANTPDDLAASGDGHQALQGLMNFDLSQPIPRTAQLNSDIDYDTNQMLRAGTGDLLPAQRRRANISMQVTGSQKALRMKQQASVYGQNLGKLAEIKRKTHAKSIEKDMKELAAAGGKNFVQNNIHKIAQGAASKLDRLKKLQL